MRRTSLWIALGLLMSCGKQSEESAPVTVPLADPVSAPPAAGSEAFTLAAPEGEAADDVDPAKLFAPEQKELQSAPKQAAAAPGALVTEPEADDLEDQKADGIAGLVAEKSKTARPHASSARANDEVGATRPAAARVPMKKGIAVDAPETTSVPASPSPPGEVRTGAGTLETRSAGDADSEAPQDLSDLVPKDGLAGSARGLGSSSRALGGGGRGLGTSNGALIARRRPFLPPPRRKIAPAGAPYRPLPPPPDSWPRDARYRSNYLPGRGYLAHLHASLAGEKTLGAAATVALDSPVAVRPSLPPPQKRALDVAIDQLHGRLSPSGGETTLRVRVRAAEAAPRARAPLRVHLVIDSSGSMRGNPWRSVCAAVKDVAARLLPTDRMSVSMYDTRGRVLSPSVVGGPDADRVADRVCATRPSGNTNIYEGLMTGYEQARAVYDPRAVNRVILLSDGIATAGPRDLHTLTLGTVEALSLGVTTSAVGVGSEFDALLMGRVASEGAGNYHFARDHRAVTAVFSDELQVLAQEAAEAVEVRVFLNPRVDLLEVVGSEPLGVVENLRARQVEVATDQRLAQDRGIAADRQWDRDGGVRFLIPSFRLGDEHAFLLRVRVPPRDSRPDLILARVALRYKDMLYDRNRRLRGERVAYYGGGEDDAEASRRPDVALAESRARAGFALERASQYMHKRNVSAIRRELYVAASWLTGAADRGGGPEVRAEATRLQRLADLAGMAETPKQVNYLAGLYHYGWRTCGLSVVR